VDFTPTPAQRELSALSRQVLADHATPDRLAGIEASGEWFDRRLWASLAAAGLLGAGLPEEAAGAGYGLTEQCTVLIEIGRAVAPVPYLETVVAGAGAIARFGTPEQVKRHVTAAIDSDLIITCALAEPGGDDPLRPAARAKRSAGGWLLTGTKTMVPFAGQAELILIPAMTDDGAAVFCVAPGDDGVTVTRQQLAGGAAAYQLALAGVRPGGGQPLGDAGRAADVLGWLACRMTVGLCALQLGVTERALELTAEYARTRQQFGRPVGAFQAVAQRLADAHIDVEAIRLSMWQAAWRANEGLPCDAEVATAKFWAADGGHRVAHTAVHVHGGVGIDTSHPLHRYFTAAKRHEFALGGATAQLRRLGALLATS
jgi:alkylation response protein AidB-like acyl-CoA dehydrogenase